MDLIDDRRFKEMRSLFKENFSVLIGKYFTQSESSLEAMQVALSKADHVEMRRHAHLLKSASAQIGAELVRQNAETIEMTKEGNEVAFEKFLPQLKQSYDDTKVVLRKALD